VRDKDRGLDARLPDPLGRTTLRGWQAKRFAPSAIHWGQCRQSLADGLAFWRPLRVTFMFAHDLSAAEQTAFRTELTERYAHVRVDYWSATEVKRRLRDSEEGRRAATWLFGTGATLEDLRLELLLSLRPTSADLPPMKLDWAHTLGVGPALDQLLSCRLLSVVLAGEVLEISPAHQRESVSTATATHNYSATDIAQLNEHETFLMLACELQAWLGRPLEPPAQPSDVDAAELARALGLIRYPQRRGTWSEVTVTLSGQPPEGVFAVALLEPVYATLFGSRIYLGIDLINLSRARVADHTGDSVRIVPAGDDTIVITLQHPDDAPAEAAHPRGTDGTARVLVRPLDGPDDSMTSGQ
jgi:hypothetical protein